MRIHTSTSARCRGCQIDRIEQGFLDLGHTITRDYSEADLVYVNNFPYDEACAQKLVGNLRGKLILTVLDCAPHVADFPMGKLKGQLAYADAVCTISETVRRDLLARGGVDSHVIFNPVKNVTKTGIKKHPYRALFVGRLGDPAKRAQIGAEALSILGFKPEEIVAVGGEAPVFPCRYWGGVSNEMLNELYNSVDFVMMTSGISEGMGLPAIEAMAAGAIPVICNDLSTRLEFFEPFREYDGVNPNPRDVAAFVARFMQDNDAKEQFKTRLHEHYTQQWAHKLSGRGVAEAILRVYEGIK